MFSSLLFAFPHTAIIPFGLVCAIAFAKILPPTVSTTPSQRPLSMGLGSLSNSALFITFFAPRDFKYSTLSSFPVTAEHHIQIYLISL